jgi:hypothetical protein
MVTRSVGIYFPNDFDLLRRLLFQCKLVDSLFTLPWLIVPYVSKPRHVFSNPGSKRLGESPQNTVITYIYSSSVVTETIHSWRLLPSVHFQFNLGTYDFDSRKGREGFPGLMYKRRQKWSTSWSIFHLLQFFNI